MQKLTWRAWLTAKRLAFQRRMSFRFKGEYYPYPAQPKDLLLCPSIAHFADYGHASLALSWERSGIGDPKAWQAAARTKLKELLGYQRRRQQPVHRHEKTFSLGQGVRRRHGYLRVSDNSDVPVSLLWSELAGSSPWPVLLYLAGSGSGVHLAWGQMLRPSDPERLAYGADMGLQAAARGYLVVCIEQSCFGERQERLLKIKEENRTTDAAIHALYLGRTLIGERIMDISSVITWLQGNEPGFEIDWSRLMIFGHSSGGSVALYAGAIDERIRAIIASGCIGFIRETDGKRSTSGEIVIPGMLQWLETDDVVRLCAPRPFIAISGVRDHIFPFQGVEAVVDSARGFYRALKAEAAIHAVAGPDKHRYYPEETWGAVDAHLS